MGLQVVNDLCGVGLIELFVCLIYRLVASAETGISTIHPIKIRF